MEVGSLPVKTVDKPYLDHDSKGLPSSFDLLDHIPSEDVG